MNLPRYHMRRLQLLFAALTVAVVAGMLPLGSAADAVVPPSFGTGCVTPAEYKAATKLGPGTRRPVIHREFGAKGVPAANLYGLRGRFRVYFACSQKAWNGRFGKGPQYWIVAVKYRDARVVRMKATNRGYRP